MVHDGHRLGWSIEETATKLPEVSEKGRERVQIGVEGYLLITAQNAAAAVERNALKPGQGDEDNPISPISAQFRRRNSLRSVFFGF